MDRVARGSQEVKQVVAVLVLDRRRRPSENKDLGCFGSANCTRQLEWHVVRKFGLILLHSVLLLRLLAQEPSRIRLVKLCEQEAQQGRVVVKRSAGHNVRHKRISASFGVANESFLLQWC